MGKPKSRGSGFSANKPVSASKKQVAKSLTDHAAKEQQALVLINQGQLQDAEAIYRELIAAGTKNHIVYGNLAVIGMMQGRHDKSIPLLQRALEIKPNFPEAHNNLGNALKEQGDLVAATASYNTALQLKPNYPEAHNNLGNALKEQGDLIAAIASYNTALQLNPNFPDAHYNLGNALKEQGDLVAAINSYNTALQLKPDYPDAHLNLGNILQEQGDLVAAITSYNTALQLKPNYPEAHNNLGNALTGQGDIDSAIASYNTALQLKPDYALARAHKLHQQSHICDWVAIENDRAYVPDLGIAGEDITPFSLLSLEDAPERHLLRSENYARQKFPQIPLSLPARPAKKPARLRIGYFSADFHNHATMYLLAQIFAVHDKSNFEIFAYSYGPNRQDKMRKKLMSHIDVFHDVREMNDMQIVDLARAEDLSIAVDLKGFTLDTRTRLFAYGLAPVQISYLGYPGTLGSDFIDYIVADHVVIPDDERQYYSEQIIYLPNAYQPTDNTRVILDKTITREDVGLPNEDFVFCCFNNNYKISPKEFDIWMRLLGKVDNSVLWLLKSNKWAHQNLRREAEVRGISSNRLIFAEQVPQAEHLARHRLADLFLDTFNYNAHTTASDALWAGLPVVTKIGKGFAARVAASLLSAIGLPELITEREEAYEALALTLATDLNELAKIKSKLEANRLTQPLFNSEMYTRHLETGYQMAYDLYLNGYQPDKIIVAA